MKITGSKGTERVPQLFINEVFIKVRVKSMEKRNDGLGVKVSLVTICPNCGEKVGVPIVGTKFIIVASHCPYCDGGFITNSLGYSVEASRKFLNSASYNEMLSHFLEDVSETTENETPAPNPQPPHEHINCRCVSIPVPRDTVIDGDDVINVKIDLENSKDVNDFIERI